MPAYSDKESRARIVAWLEYLMAEHAIPTVTALARKIGMNQAALSLVFAGKRNPGLDTAIKIHRVFHVSLDAMVDSMPPARRLRSVPVHQPKRP